VHWVDWGIIAAYGALLLFLGWRASRVEAATTESHLRADRSLPAWAVVFSILATEVSGATYVAVPSSGFQANWNYMQFAVGALLGKWVLSVWFIRLFWRLNLTTVYGFLGRRIGPKVQKTTAWAFLAGRLIATGVRLFIAAIAFSTVTGAGIHAAIAVMAAISAVFTLAGGLRAVVWTDVAQGILIMVGAGAALAFGLVKIGLPPGDLVSEALQAGKLEFLTLADDGKGFLASLRPFPVALLGGFLLVLATHGTDQENVQQLLSTRSERSSGRSIVLSGLFTFPIVMTFLACGTMLWLYVRHEPAPPFGYRTAEEARSIFPSFIMQVLPVGLRGLAFAGLLAASVAGATLNATAAAWVSDIAPRERGSGLARIRRITVVLGAILAAIGMAFAAWAAGERDELIQIALGAMTIVYPGILGTFLLALVSTTRGSDLSATAGLAAGVACGAAGFFQKDLFGLEQTVVEWPWRMLIAILVAMGVGALGRRASAGRG
jgi:SSS family transporter